MSYLYRIFIAVISTTKHWDGVSGWDEWNEGLGVIDENHVYI